MRARAGLGFAPGLGLGGGATPALGSDYGSETPYGGLGLGATPSVQSGAAEPPPRAVRPSTLDPESPTETLIA